MLLQGLGPTLTAQELYVDLVLRNKVIFSDIYTTLPRELHCNCNCRNCMQTSMTGMLFAYPLASLHSN